MRRAAHDLGVSHVTLYAWELGRATPSPSNRALIAQWSGGVVPVDAWPLTAREAAAQVKIARMAAGERQPARYSVRNLACGACRGVGADGDGVLCSHCGGTGSIGFERQRTG